jgi:excisionase family DNA binding protein
MATKSDKTLVIPIAERVFLSNDQVGALIGVSGRTVRRMILAGEIRAVKIGNATRVHRNEVDRYAAELSAHEHGLGRAEAPRRRAAVS